jgi:hypothetical protein
MLDPISRPIANAPVDDEPEAEEERQAVAESKAWFKGGHRGMPQEEMLAEFGLTTDDLKNPKNPA